MWSPDEVLEILNRLGVTHVTGVPDSTLGPWFDAIRASMAIPGLMTPKVIDGKTLVDGGLLNPLPGAPTYLDGTQFTIPLPASIASVPVEIEFPLCVSGGGGCTLPDAGVPDAGAPADGGVGTPDAIPSDAATSDPGTAGSDGTGASAGTGGGAGGAGRRPGRDEGTSADGGGCSAMHSPERPLGGLLVLGLVLLLLRRRSSQLTAPH